MPPYLVSRFLLRAPLLPVGSGLRELRAHPLGQDALALASPDLAEALARPRPGPAALAAAERYARRAAFRATPHGLLAGVAVGTLGARTTLHTAGVSALVRPSWQRLAALGRALLDEPAVRQAVRLRIAPSALLGEGRGAGGRPVSWLAFADDEGGGLAVREAELDGPAAAVLEAAADSRPWPEVRAAAAGAFGDGGEAPEEIDEYLLVLVDQGVLHHDLAPPLVGRDPLLWMRERLEALAPFSAAAAEARQALGGPTASREDLERALEAVPGHGGLHATLRHEPVRATLSREAAARAASLAPLLFRLQEALAAPAAERDLNAALVDRLDGIAEVLGAGAYALPALANGEYGAVLAQLDEEAPAATSPEASLAAYLVGALTEAARRGDDSLDLDPEALDALLPPGPPPPSFELLLTPCAPPRRGARPGEDWLLGLHAPAGASWGRFAHALGPPLAEALDELRRAEAAARPDEPTLDVAFAASTALADLCCHPPLRPRALALLSWPEGPAVAPRDLSLVCEGPGAPLGLRAPGGEPLRPSPLHRVRSTTAPGGLYRLLAGWSLVRQHAPWALAWGALGGIPRLPRVRLDGFVVAPACWRVPPAETLRGRGLARWRAWAGVPDQLQVGHEDELLLVDLTAPGAAAALARHAGELAHEVWPPLDRLADQGGRRVEAVVAVVAAPDVRAQARSLAIRASLPVPPPARRPPLPGWTTYKLFGAEDRQDLILVDAVAPLVAEALAAGEIDRWSFLRYVDPPGHRHHLRLRVRGGGAFPTRMTAALAPFRAAGDVVALETAEFFPEIARYGGPETAALVERLFQLDSELVVRLLAASEEADEPPDKIELAVRALDALARGLGLDLEARVDLAASRRAAALPSIADDGLDGPALARELRQRRRRLASLLSGAAGDSCSAALDAHATQVQALWSADGFAPLLAVLPAVLHVCLVRLLGPHPADEGAAYFFWERVSASLLARRRSR